MPSPTEAERNAPVALVVERMAAIPIRFSGYWPARRHFLSKFGGKIASLQA